MKAPLACAERSEAGRFAQEGGLGKVYQLFGDELGGIIEQLNGVWAA